MWVEISISAILACLVMIDTALFSFGHRWGSGLRLGFICLLAIVFGLYLLVKYGLILDYASLEEIHQSHALIMYTFGFVLLVLGGIPVFGACFRFIFWLSPRTFRKL